MDSSSSHDDQADAGGEESSGDDHSEIALPHTTNEASSAVDKPGKPGPDSSRKRRASESREERWKRLQSDYNDQYLNLLNESSTDDIDLAKSDLEPSQIGASKWSKSEKEHFFLALSRKSKADVRGIASSIGSKSELEVYAYLKLLEEEDINRHLYAEDVNNVGHADIPAAADLSIECDALLDKAADALNVYQDRYDRAIGEKIHQDRWMINYAQAKAYDKLLDRAEEGQSSDDSSSADTPIPAGGLFRLSSWLSLTERIFMNSDPTRSENNWLTHAAQDEVPAATQGAMSDFYELAVTQLRKVMQTSVFCAESRVRRTSDRGYAAKALVKQQDVTTAIDILGLHQNPSQFWLGLARRNQLRIVDDHRKKGRGRRTSLNYEQLESILSKTVTSRRGRRSVSSESESLSQLEYSDYGGDYEGSQGHEGTDVLYSDRSEQQAGKHTCLSTSATQNEHEAMSVDRNAQISDEAEPSSASSNDGDLPTSEDDQDDQDDQDIRLEILDQIKSRHQELQLRDELGWAQTEDIELAHLEEPNTQEGIEGTTQRKTRADVLDWRNSVPNYAESWEVHGNGPDEADFARSQRQSKRRRIEVDVGEQQKQRELAFRTTRP
jgi:RNA polymerase I-specific transcription initiation factor RRN5